MKKVGISGFILLLLSGTAFGAMTAKNLPKSPAPYGVYFAENREQFDTAARHYGYSNWHEAYEVCANMNRANGNKYNCVKDNLAHKHAEDAFARGEVAKFGFKSWDDAVTQCESKIERGDVPHCSLDPFLKIRGR